MLSKSSACTHAIQGLARLAVPISDTSKQQAGFLPFKTNTSSAQRAFTARRVCVNSLHASGMPVVAASASGDAGWTIVGGGRVGEALAKMGTNDVIVRRGETIVDNEDGPIVVCTRNDDLQGVLDVTPPHRLSGAASFQNESFLRRDAVHVLTSLLSRTVQSTTQTLHLLELTGYHAADLVFIQNGMLEPWLAERGLADNTQVLVYFAVAKRGDLPVDGKTDVNPEGLTAACGKHARAFAERMERGGLSCKVLDKTDFRKLMLEKLIWISAFMLVGVKKQADVGQVESEHRAEVEKLIAELAAAGSKALGLPQDEGTLPRLMAYARSVARFPCAIKEFPWRNGWIYSLSQQAEREGAPDPCPFHTQLLKETGSI